MPVSSSWPRTSDFHSGNHRIHCRPKPTLHTVANHRTADFLSDRKSDFQSTGPGIQQYHFPGTTGGSASVDILKLCIFLEAVFSLQLKRLRFIQHAMHGLHPTERQTPFSRTQKKRKRSVPGLYRAGPNVPLFRQEKRCRTAANESSYQTGLETVSLARPRLRRRARTLRPFLVDIRERKPCTLAR